MKRYNFIKNIGIIFLLLFIGFLFYYFNNKIKLSDFVNSPKLVDGMIPVMYDEKLKCFVKADYTNKEKKYEWYNYRNKKWANVVMVKKNKSSNQMSKSRNEYLTASAGTIILYSDILAFYVWIPRYKYTIFNSNFKSVNELDVSDASNMIIDITFEKGIESTGTVVCNDNFCYDKEYGEIIDKKSTYTHPAFTFGNEELEGIWVGKFETTGSFDNPTILPNEFSITDKNVSEHFQISRKFMSDVYYNDLNNNMVDTHMIKNIEWGSVAYLSQSIYGRCTNVCNEIYQNNSIGITGRSGGNYAGQVFDSNSYDLDNIVLEEKLRFGTYTFNNRIINDDGSFGDYYSNLGELASTTGNIYGIYDMSGGSNEYTMSVMSDLNNKPMSGLNKERNSGFNGMLSSGEYFSNGIDFPDSKYYDLYSFSDSETTYNRSFLGDALGETNGWYNDMHCMPNSTKVWSKRGCSSMGGVKAGLFYFCVYSGESAGHIATRNVLVS